MFRIENNFQTYGIFTNVYCTVLLLNCIGYNIPSIVDIASLRIRRSG